MSKRYLWEQANTPEASSNQAAVTTSVTTTATTTNLASTAADIVTLINQLRTDLINAGIIKGSA